MNVGLCYHCGEAVEQFAPASDPASGWRDGHFFIGHRFDSEPLHIRCSRIIEESTRHILPPIQVVRGNMTCGTCNAMLWDCHCATDVKCRYCGLDPNEAQFVNASMCEDSPSGNHYWLSAADRA